MRRLLVLALLLALSAGIGCSDRARQRKGRVLLVGIDGATLRVVAPLMQEGRLPNLARIASQGFHGPVQSFLPLFSPRIWTTIATGKLPEKHGIFGFVHDDAGAGSILYRSSDRKTHALWNIVSRAGLETVVVNWWATYPPERIEGLMVTDHLLSEQVEERRAVFQAHETESGIPAVYPESWQARALSLAHDEAPIPNIPDPFARVSRLPERYAREQLLKVRDRDRAVTRIALAAEQELKPILMMVYLNGTDPVSHELWATVENSERYSLEARPSPEEREVGREIVFGYYEYVDRLLGLLLERYGPEDLVIVVSDHGFEALEKWLEVAGQRSLLTGGHETEAAAMGILFARGPGIPAGSSSEGTTSYDITPTILTWLGLPVADDMDGRVAAFLHVEAPERLATYDNEPIERVETKSPGAEAEILEKLRALGYIK